MLLLALDTSSPAAGMCLLQDGQVRAEWTLRGTSPRDSDHVGMLQEMLRRARVSFADVGALACTIGPGGFTGLRVGLSFMKGLAMDGERPVFTVSTLHALARSVATGPTPVVPCLDARRGEVYGAVFAGDTPLVAEGAYAPEQFADQVAQAVKGPTLWVGEGARVYREQLNRDPSGGEKFFAPPHFDAPRAATVAALAFDAWQRGEPGAPATLVPNYLRASAAELNSGSRKRA